MTAFPGKFSFVVVVLATLVLFACNSSRKFYTTPRIVEQPNVQFWGADWSVDDRHIAVGGVDSVLRIFNPKLRIYKTFRIDNWIHSVKWHPGSHLIAVATLDRYVLLIDIINGRVTQLQAHGGARAIGWNAKGDLLAVGDLDGIVKLWNAKGELIKTIENFYDENTIGRSYLALDWHPRNDEFIVANFQLVKYNTKGEKLAVMNSTNEGAITLCVDWHPSGDFFVVGDYGHNWEGENVPSLLHFWNSNGNLIKTVSGSRGEYRNLSWNTNGDRLATASDVLRIWNKDGDLLHQSESDSTNYLWGIDWNNKAERIVTASRFKTVAIWNDKAELIRKKELFRSKNVSRNKSNSQ